MYRIVRICFVPLVFFLVFGCSGPRAYLHPSADFHFIKTIAVLPLENYTSDRFAGNKIREWATTEILRHEYVTVVDFGEVTRVFLEEGTQQVSLPDGAALKSAGERLGVQAFVTGSVEEYGTIPGSSSPVVSVTMRMLDAQSAQILWQGSYSRTGSSLGADLFGVGKENVSDVAQKVVYRLVRTMFR